MTLEVTDILGCLQGLFTPSLAAVSIERPSWEAKANAFATIFSQKVAAPLYHLLPQYRKDFTCVRVIRNCKGAKGTAPLACRMGHALVKGCHIDGALGHASSL